MLLHPASISKIDKFNFHSFIQHYRDLFLPFESVQLFFWYFFTGITFFIAVATVIFIDALFFIIAFFFITASTWMSLLAAWFLDFFTTATWWRSRRFIILYWLFVFVDLLLIFWFELFPHDCFFLTIILWFAILNRFNWLFVLSIINNIISTLCFFYLYLSFLFVLVLFKALFFRRF